MSGHGYGDKMGGDSYFNPQLYSDSKVNDSNKKEQDIKSPTPYSGTVYRAKILSNAPNNLQQGANHVQQANVLQRITSFIKQSASTPTQTSSPAPKPGALSNAIKMKFNDYLEGIYAHSDKKMEPLNKERKDIINGLLDLAISEALILKSKNPDKVNFGEKVEEFYSKYMNQVEDKEIKSFNKVFKGSLNFFIKGARKEQNGLFNNEPDTKHRLSQHRFSTSPPRYATRSPTQAPRPTQSATKQSNAASPNLGSSKNDKAFVSAVAKKVYNELEEEFGVPKSNLECLYTMNDKEATDYRSFWEKNYFDKVNQGM